MKKPTDLGAFTTSSGRRVEFEALHVELSTLGWLEGDLLLQRESFLEKLPKTIDRKFGRTGLQLQEPSPEPLPAYVFHAQFHSGEPVREGDCSSLTLVWFAESLPTDLPGELRERFKVVDWEAYAADGEY